jgi:HEAT repeat protein
LVDSQFSDVRIFAAQCLLNAKMDAVGALGFNLLIDEDTIVRSSTIRALSTRKVPGWVKVMTRSLLDDDYVIQRAAMDGLLDDRKVGIPALLEYVNKNPNSRISNLAAIELRKLGVQL